MNVRHPTGVLHSFSIKKIFYDKMDLRLLFAKFQLLSILMIIKITYLSKFSFWFTNFSP